MLAELADRVATAFQVRVVGAEYPDLLQAVAVDDLRQVLVPERRDADVLAHVFAGLHGILHTDLVHEIGPQVHALDRRAHPRGRQFDDAEAQLREALEHLAHHHGLQEHLRTDMRHQHEVRADGLFATGAQGRLVAQRLGLAPGKLGEHEIAVFATGDQARTRQVQRGRHVGFLEQGPERIPGAVRAGHAAGRCIARNGDGLGALLDDALEFLDGPLRALHVDLTRGDGAVLGALGEVDGVIVVATAHRLRALGMGAHFDATGIGEQQLGLDAHEVHRLDALVGIVGAQGSQALDRPQLVAVGLTILPIFLALDLLLVELHVRASTAFARDLLQHVGRHVHVAVAVEDLAVEGFRCNACRLSHFAHVALL